MTLIGPYGGLVDVRSSRAPMKTTPTRATSEATTLGGMRVAQRAQRSARSWVWDFTAADIGDIAKLLALEDGSYGPGPYRWYDPLAARLNMLPEHVAAAGKGTEPWRWLAPAASALSVDGPVTLDDGQRLAYSMIPTETLLIPHRQGVPDPIPVVAGRPYTASAYIEGGPGRVGLTWCDQYGAILDTDTSTLGTGRRVVTALAPAGAHGVLMRIECGTLAQALTLDGSAGTYAVTPDHASLDIVGDISLRAEIVTDDWTPTIEPRLIAKFAVDGNQCSFQLRITNTGALSLVWSTNGSATGAPGFSSTVPIPGVPGEPLGLRADLDVDNGAGGHTVSFYISGDWSTWVPLGTPRIGTGITSIYSGSAPVSLGARTGPEGNQFTGRIRRAEIRNSAGAVVTSPDFRSPGNGWLPGDNAATTPRADAQGRAWDLTGAAAIEEYIETAAGARVAGLQLTETDTAIAWHTGVGIPRVAINRTSEALRVLAPEAILRDESFTLLEVG